MKILVQELRIINAQELCVKLKSLIQKPVKVSSHPLLSQKMSIINVSQSRNGDLLAFVIFY